MMRLRKRPVQFLPGYPPAINPDELVWSHAKRAGTTHRLLQGGEVLRERSDAQLDAARSSPELVAKSSAWNSITWRKTLYLYTIAGLFRPGFCAVEKLPVRPVRGDNDASRR